MKNILALVVIAISLAITSYLTVHQNMTTGVRANISCEDANTCTVFFGGTLTDSIGNPIRTSEANGRCAATVSTVVKWVSSTDNTPHDQTFTSWCVDANGRFDYSQKFDRVKPDSMEYSVFAHTTAEYGRPQPVSYIAQPANGGCRQSCNFVFPNITAPGNTPPEDPIPPAAPGVINEQPCIDVSGACQGGAAAGGSCTVNGLPGLYQPNRCPTQGSDVLCCVPNQGGGDPGVPPPVAPPPAGGPSTTIGGVIQASDTGVNIPGVTVVIGGRVTATGVTTEQTAISDGNGYFGAIFALGPGDSYNVRPQGAPAGFNPPAGTSNDSYSRAANTGANTPVRSGSYEQQVIGQQDCASTPGWTGGACNFVYDRAAAPPPAQNPPPVTKACVVRNGPPPVVELPPEDLNATAKKDMDITIVTFLPTGPGGTAGPNPAETTMPVDVAVANAARAEDAEVVTVNMNYKGAGLWEGKYSTQHFPGTQYSFTLWPKKFAKKTLCHVGSNSPHSVYATTYECAENEGTIVLKSGANHLDFSRVKMGAGDLSVEETRDGHVDSQDLYQLVEYMRNPARENTDGADLNLDGQINQQDYDLAVWSIQNVPE